MKNFDLSFIQDELKRISGWIEFSDKKTAFISAYYSLIFGLVVSQKKTILQNLANYQGSELVFFIIFSIIFIVFFSLGIFFITRSVFPRLKNSFTDKSFFYFKNVADMKFSDYLDGLDSLSEDKVKEQLIEQLYSNSVIASKKMVEVQKSIKCFFGLVVIILIFALFS